MKKTIHPADAWRLAQAKELIKAHTKHVDPLRNSEGKIVPSRESLEEINREYSVSDATPPHETPRGEE